MRGYMKAQKPGMGKATSGAKGQKLSHPCEGGPAAPKGNKHSGSMKAHKSL